MPQGTNMGVQGDVGPKMGKSPGMGSWVLLNLMFPQPTPLPITTLKNWPQEHKFSLAAQNQIWIWTVVRFGSLAQLEVRCKLEFDHEAPYDLVKPTRRGKFWVWTPQKN
jgi:hypothetical protein